MRRMLHLVMILAVMLVTMHVGETHAHETPGEHASEQTAASVAGEPDQDSPADDAPPPHHHCPVAEDRHLALVLPDALLAAALHFPPAAAALGSLAQAPPVEPPHA
jgi:hypothetical protein